MGRETAAKPRVNLKARLSFLRSQQIPASAIKHQFLQSLVMQASGAEASTSVAAVEVGGMNRPLHVVLQVMTLVGNQFMKEKQEWKPRH